MKRATPTLKQSLFVACGVLLLLASGCARRANRQSADAPPPAADGVQPVRVSPAGADAAEPATATAPGGGVYVAWVEHREDDEADVMLARFDGAGQAQGAPTRVNAEAGKATAWRGDPPTVAVSGDGVVYVGWTARVEPSSLHADDLYLSASRDGGRSFDAPVKVNDDQKPAVHGMHSLAVAPDGRVHLAWLDERNVTQPQPSEMAEGHHMESNREVFAAYSADGGRTISPNLRVATDACPCCKTALAVGPAGRLYVSWRQVLPGDYRHIAVASSTDGGETYSQPVVVSDDRWQIAGCPVSGPALAAGADGALRVLWYSEGQAGDAGLYWSESVDGGRTFAPRRLLSSGRASGTPVLLAGDSSALTAVWCASDGGSARLVTATFDGDARLMQDTVAMSSVLPAAAALEGKLFMAYVSKAGGQHSIWLVRARQSA